MEGKGKKILIIVLWLISLGCAVYLILHFIGARQTQNEYEEIREEATEEVVVHEEEAEVPEKKVEIPIDFETLWEQNSDVYAWIRIPGTHVDFPVLQHPTDDLFYLNYNIDKEWDAAVGAIFSQSYNKKDFSDFNTILYGHRMGEENPLMFYDLRLYWDADFMDEHRDIYIYTPTNIYRYKVFAAVVSDNRHHMLYYDEFEEEEDKQAFLDYLWNSRDMRNQYRDDVSVTTDDRILTLSTCIRWEKKNRLLIGAVLVDED